jgi:hypothetical protein
LFPPPTRGGFLSPWKFSVEPPRSTPEKIDSFRFAGFVSNNGSHDRWQARGSKLKVEGADCNGGTIVKSTA